MHKQKCEEITGKMPKIDLHCHLDGSMGIEVTRKLLKQQGKDYTSDQLKGLLQVPEDCTSLTEYLKRFELPILCLQTRDGLYQAAYDLAVTAAAENTVYLEIRFAPSFSREQGLSVCEIIESVEKGLAQAGRETGIRTGIIVCGMRGLPMETNLSMLKEARELLGTGVVACDLAGDENSYPAVNFVEFFNLAKKLGMPFTIHAGECGSRTNIRDSIEFGVARLGHGIAMTGDFELMKLCANRRIGVELCPTSNFQTKAVHSWKEYPLREFMEQGVMVSVNTDNRTVSGTDSTTEFKKIMEHFSLTTDELKKIYEMSAEMVFAGDDCKQELLKKWSI